MLTCWGLGVMLPPGRCPPRRPQAMPTPGAPERCPPAAGTHSPGPAAAHLGSTAPARAAPAAARRPRTHPGRAWPGRRGPAPPGPGGEVAAGARGAALPMSAAPPGPVAALLPPTAAVLGGAGCSAALPGAPRCAPRRCPARPGGAAAAAAPADAAAPLPAPARPRPSTPGGSSPAAHVR